jgi:hypothetical protein
VSREQALERIRLNIARHGHHVYLVQGGRYPRFSYTIGLVETHGAEVVFAGGIHYMADESHLIMNAIPGQLRAGKSIDAVFEVAGHGSFTLRKADPSWTHDLLLGARDYYGREVPAYQLVPDDDHWTICP